MGNFKRGGDRGFGGNRGGSRGGNFQRGGFNKRGFGGGKFGGNREVVMHDAVCDECKQNCQIPFLPSNDKPVYCKDCFSKRNGGNSRPGFGNGPRRDFGDRPRRDQNFSANRGGDNRGNDEVKKLLESMNTKLDSLVRILENKKEIISEKKDIVATESSKKVKEVKPKAKAKVAKKVGKK